MLSPFPVSLSPSETSHLSIVLGKTGLTTSCTVPRVHQLVRARYRGPGFRKTDRERNLATHEVPEEIRHRQPARVADCLGGSDSRSAGGQRKRRGSRRRILGTGG